ncbi:hypothetical protein LXL04_030446 [Taraxacum kok-saghyz]
MEENDSFLKVVDMYKAELCNGSKEMDFPAREESQSGGGKMKTKRNDIIQAKNSKNSHSIPISLTFSRKETTLFPALSWKLTTNQKTTSTNLHHRVAQSTSILVFLPHNARIKASSEHGIVVFEISDSKSYGLNSYYVCKPATKQVLALPNPKSKYLTQKVAIIVLNSNPLHYKIVRLSRPVYPLRSIIVPPPHQLWQPRVRVNSEEITYPHFCSRYRPKQGAFEIRYTLSGPRTRLPSREKSPKSAPARSRTPDLCPHEDYNPLIVPNTFIQKNYNFQLPDTDPAYSFQLAGAAFEIVAQTTKGNEKLENGGVGWCARGDFVATSAPRSPRAMYSIWSY